MWRSSSIMEVSYRSKGQVWGTTQTLDSRGGGTTPRRRTMHGTDVAVRRVNSVLMSIKASLNRGIDQKCPKIRFSVESASKMTPETPPMGELKSEN